MYVKNYPHLVPILKDVRTLYSYLKWHLTIGLHTSIYFRIVIYTNPAQLTAQKSKHFNLSLKRSLAPIFSPQRVLLTSMRR